MVCHLNDNTDTLCTQPLNAPTTHIQLPSSFPFHLTASNTVTSGYNYVDMCIECEMFGTKIHTTLTVTQNSPVCTSMITAKNPTLTAFPYDYIAQTTRFTFDNMFVDNGLPGCLVAELTCSLVDYDGTSCASILTGSELSLNGNDIVEESKEE